MDGMSVCVGVDMWRSVSIVFLMLLFLFLVAPVNTCKRSRSALIPFGMVDSR